jgi:hypothetical protein
MIGLKAKPLFTPQALLAKTKQATYRNLGHAAASIRKGARQSMKPRRGPSRAGRPPHTHRRRKNLPNAILYAVEAAKDAAVIGPAQSRSQGVGKVQEHGGYFRGRRYDARPFMGPALQQATPRLPLFWRESIR